MDHLVTILHVLMMPTWLDETRRQKFDKFLVWEFLIFRVILFYFMFTSTPLDFVVSVIFQVIVNYLTELLSLVASSSRSLN
jgi:Na+/melibiose symporter-like transporter